MHAAKLLPSVTPKARIDLACCIAAFVNPESPSTDPCVPKVLRMLCCDQSLPRATMDLLGASSCRSTTCACGVGRNGENIYREKTYEPHQNCSMRAFRRVLCEANDRGRIRHCVSGWALRKNFVGCELRTGCFTLGGTLSRSVPVSTPTIYHRSTPAIENVPC